MISKGLKRNNIDKFYTKEEVVNICISKLINKIDLNIDNDLIIEPSAGNGAFINYIKSNFKNYIFYDIIPEHPEIVKQDYLELNLDNEIINKYNKIHVIGNPPFGRNSSTAIKFIKKSCEFCHSISFILPKSFKKNSLIKHFPLLFHKVFEFDLPEKSFLVEGKEYNVETTFQIWEKRNYLREIVQILKPNHFIFVKQEDSPDISFRRVGINAGKIELHSSEVNKSIQSHYFIKFTNMKDVLVNIESLAKIEFEFNNTVGPKSISKQELIIKFNEIL